MSQIINIKKGLDIRLKGKSDVVLSRPSMADSYAIKPTDFHGVTPKLSVNIGDKVKAGAPLFFDKNNPKVLFTSPVSGEVVDVVRGERRKILEVIVKADSEVEYQNFDITKGNFSAEEIKELMLISGLWPSVIQRPYGIIANAEDSPRDIFVSCFDSAPLATDIDFMVKDEVESFTAGVKALQKLTSGKVHFGLNADYQKDSLFTKIDGVEIHYFRGMHPAGNVGTQIHKVNPISKGDIVWTIAPQHIIMLGRLLTKGIYDASQIISLGGSEVKKTGYFKVISGASISNLVDKNVNNENELRYISGNVLTGQQISKDGFLGYYSNSINVIPEGRHFEFIGWALPGLKKFSMSKTFFSWMTPKKEYSLDTNLNGGDRAFVMSGQYEKVVPMDIYPVHLLKAILAEDIDKMEQLGIYEIIEEDFALCEFVCTSKIDVQHIVRQGLDLMVKELG